MLKSFSELFDQPNNKPTNQCSQNQPKEHLREEVSA